ncbi:CLUMA_CG017055, isoform A [Clunio marinus]|uniref:CLUMA_CG017055, isoform A n=1 Tax=Clunio marinus TaxID=568069 RepID=A0A1J1IXP8_9DIPT|nr:CLUMA_CG017055, isoform A [Clunio marinus]
MQIRNQLTQLTFICQITSILFHAMIVQLRPDESPIYKAFLKSVVVRIMRPFPSVFLNSIVFNKST